MTYGWRGFALWFLVGIPASLVVALFPLGLLIIPLLLWLVSLMQKRVPLWPEAIGAGLAPSLLSLFIAFVHRDTRTCEDVGAEMGRTVFYCRSIEPERWLNAGLILGGACLVGFAVVHHLVRSRKGVPRRSG